MLMCKLGTFKMKQSRTLSSKEQDQYDGNSTSFFTLWRWEIVKPYFFSGPVLVASAEFQDQ